MQIIKLFKNDQEVLLLNKSEFFFLMIILPKMSASLNT